jgi:CBS domain-containing protein
LKSSTGGVRIKLLHQKRDHQPERAKENSLNREIELHFRDQLRDARADALKDAEAFEQLVFVVERIAIYLTGNIENLGAYAGPVSDLAKRSPLAADIPALLPGSHAPFATLYDLVRQARNDALHEGAFARHLTRHAVELSIILEDALMVDASCARDFMVSDPVCALWWQPISSIRRSILENSFSYLPVAMEGNTAHGRRFLSDFSVASYLREAQTSAERYRRLARQLGEAVKAGEIRLIDAPSCGPEDSVATILERSKGLPVLVIGPDGDLRGIVTPFDVL